MKELIRALRACLAVADLEGQVTTDQVKLVNDHINSLVDHTIRNHAIDYIKLFMRIGTKPSNDIVAGALANIAMMLVPYGSKADAILAVIHDKGWTDVTIEDVNAVRNFILEQ